MSVCVCVCVLMFLVSLSTVPEICLLRMVLNLHAFLTLTISGELYALAALHWSITLCLFSHVGLCSLGR